MLFMPGVLFFVVVCLLQTIESFHPWGPTLENSVWRRRGKQRFLFAVESKDSRIGAPGLQAILTPETTTTWKANTSADSPTDENDEATAQNELLQLQLLCSSVTSTNSDSVANTIFVPNEEDLNNLIIIANEITAEKQQQQQRERDILWARLLLLGAAALYGTNFSLVKLMGESELPVGLSTTIRFAMAALATSPWLFGPAKTSATATTTSSSLEDSNINQLSPAIGAVLGGLEVGMWNSIGYLSQAVGLETTLASKSAFFCSLAVVVVPLLDRLAGRKLKSEKWVGALLALVGVAILELGEVNPGDILSSFSVGDAISLIQPLAFGMGFWRMERAMQRYPNEANRCTAGQLLATFIAASVYCYVTEGGHSWDWNQLQTWLSDPTLLAFLAWTGVASTALSVYMETIALKTLSAAETTLLLSTEPLWGAGWAALIIGEHVGMDAALGGFMILAGCLYSNLGLGGLWSFVKGKNDKKGAEAKQQQQLQQPITSIPGAEKQTTDPMSPLLGMSAMVVASEMADAWNNLCMGARVAILQMQDFIDELF